MTESGVWQTLKKGLQCTGAHMTRIESSAGNGVPDVSIGIRGRNSWIELKYIAEWPKRETTKVKLPLRPEQKHWINARGQLSGDVWVFIRIDDCFFLLSWEQALEAIEGWTQKEWEWFPDGYWRGKVNWGELCDLLQGGC